MTEVSDEALGALPKVELHVHLEGSVRAATAIALARRRGEDPDAVLVLEDGGYPARYDDFLHFVATILATSRQLSDPQDIADAAEAFARQQAAGNVRYSEVTFTAKTHVDNGIPADELWTALGEGIARVPEVEVGVIVDAVRDLGVGHAEATVGLVEDAIGRAPIVGLGLAGIEGSRPEADFGVLREAADRLGIGLAVHAGETGDADNVRGAVEDLGADRIGHGIAVVADPALMARLARDGVVFEVCPSSNLRLGVVDDLDAHPLRAMWEAGLNVTVNSDDPPFFATTLTEELRHAERLCELDRDGLAELQRRAARAAFAPEATRERLLAEIDAWAGGGA